MENKVNKINSIIRNENKSLSALKKDKKIKEYDLKQIRKNGYRFNSKEKQFEKLDKGTKLNMDKKENTKEKIYDNDIDEILDSIVKRLNEIEKRLDKKEEKSLNNKEEKENINIYICENIDKINGELVSRNLKISNKINKRWMKFCKENKMYKIPELTSIALLYFLDNFEK